MVCRGPVSWKFHFVSAPRLSIKKIFGWLRNSKSKTIKVVTWETNKMDVDVEKSQEKSVDLEKNDVKKSIDNKTYNGLTQSEIRETEEIFSILF